MLLAMPTMVWFRRSTTPFCCEMAHHPLVRVVRGELHRREFTASISTQHAQLLPGLCLCSRLELLDRRRRFVLAGYQSQPHVPAAVINQEKVPTPTVRGRRDWPTQIAVDDL
jgi:hypothetical protein